MSLVVHVPHASTVVPDEYRNQFLLSDAELKNEVFASADLHTDLLAKAAWPHADIVEPDVARVVCDVERYADDEKEEMAAVGRGMIYLSTHDCQPLRASISTKERDEIKRRYYDPHWSRLRSAAIGKILIDLHSYPTERWPIEFNHGAERPQIDIGATEGLTPKEWRESLIKHFEGLGYETGLNTPYSGVIDAGARASVMIEIRRDALGRPHKSPEWTRLVRTLATIPFPKGFACDGQRYDTLALYSAATGLDAHSKGEEQNACDVVFVNRGSDMHLDPDDTCAKDAGTPIPAYTTVDFDKDSRPQSTHWDIGADEYSRGYVPEGACCTSGVCSSTTEAACSGATWQGAGTTCTPDPCEPPVIQPGGEFAGVPLSGATRQ